MTRTQDHHHDGTEVHAHDLGLSHDLPMIVSRRRLLGLLGGGAGALALSACGSSSSTSAAASSSPSASASASASAAATAAATTQIPAETAGPYPGDGSNGVNVLTASGVVRSDIRSSFGTSTTTAEGVPLRIALTVVDTRNGGAPLEGAAVYLWHCDASGAYSMYDRSVADENYLRGVQAADADGRLAFDSIYPAAYSGRWPHIHFEVYADLDGATSQTSKLRTSQLALPEDVSTAVYADSRYSGSARNLSRTSLATDMVFADGYSLQLATVTGSNADGYTASLVVPV